MNLDKTKVKRILVITLSNIGDAVLTTPVIQTLRENFPQSYLAVLVGPRAFDVFKNDQSIDRKIIYDKSISRTDKFLLINNLRMDKYDLVVDLRHTLFAPLLGARYRSSLFTKAPRSLRHMKDRHLWKLKSLGLEVDYTQGPCLKYSVTEVASVNKLLAQWQLKKEESLIAIAPGARNMTKRWKKQGFIQLTERLIKECRVRVVVVGDQQDKALVQEIINQAKFPPLDACGQTSIEALAYLLTKCKLLVTNDSAPMHLAWAVKRPVVAMFGPTDYKKYAPTGLRDVVVYQDLPCVPCEQSLCPKGTCQCLRSIEVDQVFEACKRILDGKLPENTDQPH